MIQNSHYCQSCSMPMETDELKGFEKNGSKNNDYCKYCYDKGAFINPNISMIEMKEKVRKQMEAMHLPIDLENEMIQLSENILPTLKRWRSEK